MRGKSNVVLLHLNMYHKQILMTVIHENINPVEKALNHLFTENNIIYHESSIQKIIWNILKKNEALSFFLKTFKRLNFHQTSIFYPTMLVSTLLKQSNISANFSSQMNFLFHLLSHANDSFNLSFRSMKHFKCSTGFLVKRIDGMCSDIFL